MRPESSLAVRIVGIGPVERKIYRELRKYHPRGVCNFILAGFVSKEWADTLRYGANIRKTLTELVIRATTDA